MKRASSTTAPLTTWDDPLCSHNSPGKQGGPLTPKEKKGRESLGRKVCVLACLYVCAGFISTSFNPPYPCTPYPHSPAKNQWQTPVKTEYLTFKAKSRGTY